MKTLLISLLLALFNIICFAQDKKNITDVRNIFDEKGDYYFDRKDYKKAIVYYNMAYQKDSKNYYSVLRKAEAYSKMDLYDQAAESYRIIFNTDLYISNEHRLDFALLLLKNKDITGFEKQMKEYNEITRSEIYDYLNASNVRSKMYKDSSFIILENEQVVNSAESEISPFVYKNQLLFASTRKNLVASSGNNYYNIFVASYLEDGHLGRLNVFNKNLNSTQNESALFVSAATNKMYVTRSSTQNAGLKVMESTIPADVNSAVDLNSFSVAGFQNIGQVCMNSKGTKIYFVSDAPGGSGGLDIYSSTLEGGKWSKPENMGSKINTAKDETYPFILNDTLLYFSSTGHNGFGGSDLFVMNLNHKDAQPKNLGNKVNTEYDEFSLAFSPSGLTGYFSSNRPGGFGKEDIYRVHLMDIKVKLPAYRFKRKTTLEDDKINLYLSDGEEHNIASDDKSGFSFTFRPEEPYKMVIRHENPLAGNIVYNNELSSAEKKKEFLNPEPFQKTDIRLEPGMKYQFAAGMKPISAEYKKELNDMASAYTGGGGNTIDLTALAKELLLKEGEIYTIRFVKDDSRMDDIKSKELSTLSINNEVVDVNGRSFFIVLPLDIQANFNIKTDIGYFKETYSPKKVGAVKVDEAPVIKEEAAIIEFEGFPILVNTESFDEVSKNKIKATELSIIPGSMYILTLRDKTLNPETNPGIVIPLTKGVKYNLGSEAISQDEYNKSLAKMNMTQAENDDEELIDISVLSKELDIIAEKNIVFSLTPTKSFGTEDAASRRILTTLNVDGRKYFMTTMQRVEVNLKLPRESKVNIQTDLDFVKENFIPSTVALNVDTVSFNTDIKEKMITDPVFDVVVVNFNLNDYSIRPDAKSILAEKVIGELKKDSRLYVTIKGYTDALGDADYNEKLSQNRAQAVKDFLSNNGIGESRIRTFSFGESMSLKDGKNWEDLSEEELQKHRKVEIIIYLPKAED